MPKCILLKRTGGIVEIFTPSIKSKTLSAAIRKKGDGKPKVLVIWEIDGFEYKLFGHKYGRAGKENKHDLPPPVDNEL